MMAVPKYQRTSEAISGDKESAKETISIDGLPARVRKPVGADHQVVPLHDKFALNGIGPQRRLDLTMAENSTERIELMPDTGDEKRDCRIRAEK